MASRKRGSTSRPSFIDNEATTSKASETESDGGEDDDLQVPTSPRKRSRHQEVPIRAIGTKNNAPTVSLKVDYVGDVAAIAQKAVAAMQEAAAQDPGDDFTGKAFYSDGFPCQLSPSEETHFRIPAHVVKDLRYGHAYTSFCGFPLKSFPDDVEGLVLGYSPKRGQNYFYTRKPGFGKVGGTTPLEKAKLVNQGSRYTPQFFWLADIFVLTFLSLKSEPSGESAVSNLGVLRLLAGSKKTLDPMTLLIPRVYFSVLGGKKLSNLPRAEQEKAIAAAGPEDEDILRGVTPKSVYMNINYETYFNNGNSRRKVAHAPTAKHKNFELVGIYFDFLAEGIITGVRESLVQGKEVRNGDVVMYNFPFKKMGQSISETCGLRLDIPSWFEKGDILLPCHADGTIWFQAWIQDPRSFYRGREQKEDEPEVGLSPDQHYAIQGAQVIRRRGGKNGD